MKNILYIGNKLSNKHSNVSAIGVLGPLLEASGYTLQYASSKSNKILRLLDMIWICLKSYRKVEWVLIDTYSTQNFYYALVVSQLCRLLRMPYIPILHGGNLERRLRHNSKFCDSIFSNSTVNVAPSHFMKSVFANYGFTNVVFIPNSLRIVNYKFEKRSIEKIKMLWVRSFSNIYNPLLAVKVLKLLIDSGYEAELCMVGPDSDDGSFQDTQKLAKELRVSIIFTGKLAKTEWTTLATEYNVFVNTTNFDNMPVSVVEAMALGLPIVSTNVGGMPNLIEGSVDGLLVPQNDEHAFVDAILRLKSDSNFKSLIVENARKKVEKFDWGTIKEKWFEILK